jgi:hypothetical protein
VNKGDKKGLLLNRVTLIGLFKRLLSFVGRVVLFVFFLGMLSLFIGGVLIDQIKPTILFKPYILSLIIAMLIALAAYVTLKMKVKKTKSDWLSRWPKKRKRIVFVLIVAVLIGVPLAIAGTRYLSDQRLLEHASTQFQIEASSLASQGQIENTLVELERQLTKLRSSYVEEPPDYMIKVRMFTDVSELQGGTSSPDWADAFVRITPGESPIIYIPVEPESQRFGKSAPTDRPAHEITHVVTYEALKFQSMTLIPRFFCEALAQYESLKGMPNLLSRLSIRIFLFTLEPSLVLRDEPPDLYLETTQKDVDIFYALSYEFGRYLADEYGEEKLWRIVQLVGDGIEFGDAFTNVTGRQYLDAYKEFSQNWLYAPVIVKYREWQEQR